MNFVEAIILGLVQGLTEFLPVSSSGHLVLVENLMGIKKSGITFEIMLHFGTLLSVIIYFWKILWRMVLAIIPPFKAEYERERRWIGYLFLASIPAGIVGFSPLTDVFEGVYAKPAVVGLLLVCTGLMLFLPRLLSKRKNPQNDVKIPSAMVMGIGQAIAILPGVSRSGSTIVSGMLSGVKSSNAAEFSFLMAIPAIAAATVKEIPNMGALDPEMMTNYLAGTAVSFLSGLFAIFAVLTAIRKGKFEWFGVYCLIVGIAAFCYFSLKA